MATAELERTVFTPPAVETTQPVLFYPNGLKTKEPQFAYVINVTGNVVDLMTASVASGPTIKPCVRHIDDPAISHNPNIARYGGWDFTERHKREQAKAIADAERWAKVQERLQALESRVNGLTSKK